MSHQFIAAASAAAALLLAAGAASAQNAINAGQLTTASGSTLVTDQTTAQNAAITTFQEGIDSDIEITQELGSRAAAYVHQGLVRDSSTTITQINGRAHAVVSQFGAANVGSGEVRVRQHFGGGDFAENDATVQQFGASASLALVEQVGDSQEAFIRQDRTQPGATADILQVGGANDARIEQTEGSSSVTITQGALGHNVYANSALVIATGAGNHAAVYQGSDGATAIVEVEGSDNYMQVSQLASARADISQGGEDNRLVLTQVSSGVSALLTQMGSGNVMTVTQ